MLATASLLLLTSLLAQAQAPASSSPPDTSSRVPASASAQSEGGQPTTSVEPPHQIGIGGAMGMSSRGGGTGFRYFFGDRIGVNANVMWYRPTSASSSTQGSTFVAAPSFVYMLTKSSKVADLDLRPYVGGGLNFATWSSSSPTSQTGRTTTSVSQSSRSNGVGTQVFGGVEATFLNAKAIAISAEVAHYEFAVSNIATALAQGTTFTLLFHYYLK